MLLLIDNYDSFTHNLARYFVELGQAVKVVRNDELSLDDIAEMSPEHIVLSPGPCTPNQAGICLDVVKRFTSVIPILGVCLGHQAIAQAFGANIGRAKAIKHGMTSHVCHANTPLFANVKQGFTATRYHSLVIEPDSLPDVFEVTAWVNEANKSDENTSEIMAIEHKHLPLCGVQFHPESLLTEYGHQILENFLNLSKA